MLSQHVKHACGQDCAKLDNRMVDDRHTGEDAAVIARIVNRIPPVKFVLLVESSEGSYHKTWYAVPIA